MIDEEFQTEEYAPDGPVQIAPTTTDRRARLNKDGSKSPLKAERPVHTSDRDLLRAALMRIEVLELQVKSLQLSAKTDLARR